MAHAGSHIAAFVLLVFIKIIHGTQSLFDGHQTAVNATVGQNVSLACIMSDKTQSIIQLQWHKVRDAVEQKLVLFNPNYPIVYYKSVRLELVNRSDPKALGGSILHLYEVTEEDSSDYVCSITAFPHGSIQCSTKVHVKAPEVQLKVTSPNRTLIEGDDVSITCVSDPPADSYSLSCTQSGLTWWSLDGSFRIQNIPRHCRTLTCRPQWNSSAPHSQNLQLSVDYLDVECDSRSQIAIKMSSDLMITCQANASTSGSLQFVWTKGSETLSHNATINLWSVNPDRSGIYTLTVRAENQPHLYQEKNFSITVLNRTHAEDLQSSTVAMKTTPATINTTEESEVTVTSQPPHTNSTTSTILTTFTEQHLNTSSIAPSTGDTTTVPANTTNSTSALASSDAPVPSEWRNTKSRPGFTGTEFTQVHPNSSTTFFTSTFMSSLTVPTRNVSLTEDKKDLTNTKSHVVYIIIPVLLLLFIIGFLYRRYLIQKRMDLPPPFKPPPPPVKYTSSRAEGFPVTGILAWSHNALE